MWCWIISPQLGAWLSMRNYDCTGHIIPDVKDWTSGMCNSEKTIFSMTQKKKKEQYFGIARMLFYNSNCKNC